MAYWGSSRLMVAAVFVLLGLFSNRGYSDQTTQWPCPEFGPCRFQLIIGQCEAFIFFEYTKSFQVRGKDQVSFWQADNPKPCALTLRVGRNKERYTFEKYYCQEILGLFEKAASTHGAVVVSGTSALSEVFECNAADHGGLMVVTFPDPLVQDGLWRPIRRQTASIAHVEQCTIQKGDRLIVCSEVDDAVRDWLRELMARLKWNVIGRPLVKNRQHRKLNLAPGDRMRSDQ